MAFSEFVFFFFDHRHFPSALSFPWGLQLPPAGSAVLIAVTAKADQATSKDRGALFAITENGLWGYINRKGDVVVEPQFQMAGPFFEGMAEIIENFKVGFIDVTGRVVIKPQLEPAMFRSFREGLAHVQVAGKVRVEG